MSQKYGKEFKLEAVRLSLEDGADRKKVAENLGVNYKTLCNWIYATTIVESEAGQDNVDLNHKAMKDEIKKLKKELKNAQMERDILKKATAYFAKHSL